MSNKFVLVSGGDARYFSLLHELAKSIRSLGGPEEYPVCFLDGGLTETNKQSFQKLDVFVKKLDWCHPLAEKRCKGREFLKINIAKLHLDKLFPDYRHIIWLDGDTWLQNPVAIELFCQVASKKKLAIVSEASRLQALHLNFRSKLAGLVELRNILYKNGKRAGLPKTIVANLMGRPTLNAGAYALSRDSAHWARFRYWQDIILNKGRLFTSDQLAMGLTIYEDALAYEALPDICNYRGPWRWDEANRVFVDYFAPYDPVSVVHLCGQDEMRDNPDYRIEMLNTEDEKILKSLRYSAVCE